MASQLCNEFRCFTNAGLGAFGLVIAVFSLLATTAASGTDAFQHACSEPNAVVAYGGAGEGEGRGIAVRDGAVYVTGGTNLSTNLDLVVLKYVLPSGGLQFEQVWLGDHPTPPCVTPDQHDLGDGIAVTGEGAYVAGFTLTCASDGVGDKEGKSLLLKVDPATGSPLWWHSPNLFGYTGGEYFFAAASAVEGADTFVYAAGTAQANGANFTSTLAKYAATGGPPVWALPYLSQGFGVHSRNQGVVTAGGMIYASGFNDDAGAGSRKAHLLKVQPDGTEVWTRHHAPAGTQAEGWAVATDGSGGFYVVGFAEPGPSGGKDVLVVKWDQDGNFQWDALWGGTAEDWAYGAVFLAGSLYVPGHTRSLGAGGSDVFLLELDPADGSLRKEQLWGGAMDETARAISTDGLDLFLTGSRMSSGAGGRDLVVLRWPLCPSTVVLYGGAGEDEGRGIAVRDGAVYVTGGTNLSTNLDLVVLRLVPPVT